MKLGIKVGLQKTSIDDLIRSKPDMAEVWFDINRKDEYAGLFKTLHALHIDVGLHFWAVLADQSMANITYKNPDVNDISLSLIKKTIDIASQNKFSYVNIHPGPRINIALDLHTFQLSIRSKSTPLDVATNNFLTNAHALDGYAKQKQIVLTVETVPPYMKNGSWMGTGQDVVNVHELPIESLIQAAHEDLWIANDLSHTVANCDSCDPAILNDYLKQKTLTLAAQTRLIHVGFAVIPHRGVDLHASLDNPDFVNGQTIPSAATLHDILKPFSGRTDVWALVEPDKNHVKNYELLKKYI